MILLLTRNIFFTEVPLMNLRLNFLKVLLLALVESLINIYFVSLAQGTFNCSSNTLTTIWVLRLRYIRADVSFYMGFISGQCLHDVLFCRNDLIRFEGVYLRPEMKYNINEVSFLHEKNYACITCNYGWGEMKRNLFRGGRGKTAQWKM